MPVGRFFYDNSIDYLQFHGKNRFIKTKGRLIRSNYSMFALVKQANFESKAIFPLNF